MGEHAVDKLCVGGRPDFFVLLNEITMTISIKGAVGVGSSSRFPRNRIFSSF